MKRNIVAISTLFVSVALSGCASSGIKDIGAFQKAPLQNAEVMPSKAALAGAKPRVVVFELEDKKGSAAGDQVADAIIKELNDTKNVVVVDRALATKLEQEITLAETKGRTGYTGQSVADFAITGKITSAAAGNSYTAPSSWTDKEGKSHYVSAQCTTAGKIAFAIKISQLPSLDVVDTFDVEAVASSSQDVQYSYCPTISDAAAKGIISAAAASAVQKRHTDLKNQFAPVGYVLERRTFEKTNIFKISLGKSGGAKQDLKVQVLHSTTETNGLTGATTSEQVRMAEGVISDQIGESFSFVIVKDAPSAENIKLGDLVKVQFEDSFGDVLNKIAH
jgi:curli biogenesis system outer membrane secretion channel CsgG